MAYVVALSFFSYYATHLYPASIDYSLVLEEPDGKKGFVWHRHCADFSIYQYAAAENGGRAMVQGI